MKNARFARWLAAGLFAATAAAQRELLDRLPPGGEAVRYARHPFAPELAPVALPGVGEFLGMARIGERLWIARGVHLHCIDWASGTELRTADAPADLAGLCADERFLYGTVGTDLHVFDPIVGVSMRTVTIAGGWPPGSLAMHAGRIHAVIDRTLVTIDPATGATTRIGSLGADGPVPLWLASDGAQLWYGDRHGLGTLYAERGLTALRREWSQPVRAGAAAWVDGRLLLALDLEEPPGIVVVRADDGPEVMTRAGWLPPESSQSKPTPNLGVRLQRDVDGALLFQIGSWPPVGERELPDALHGAARDPALRVVGADGQPTPIPIAFVVGPAVTVAELLCAWDEALAAGFVRVSSPLQEEWARMHPGGAPSTPRTERTRR